jgi:nucleotide-binding universal stress UspA family protein
MTKKILVPLDGSTMAEAVLPLVVRIAQADQAEVELVTVLTPVAIWDSAASMIKWDAEEAAAREYINAQVGHLTGLGLKASATVAYGEAAPAVLDRAKAGKADLVAITTHGRSGLARWFLGSVAEKLLHSKAPMLVVRPADATQPIAPLQIRKVLVPLDGSQLSLTAIPAAEKMAKTFGASLVFCTVVTTDWVAYAGMEAPAVYQDVFDDMKKSAEENLERAAAESRKRGFKVDGFIGVGSVSDEIQRIATEQEAALIVLSTHGRSGPSRWVMGSTADALVRRSHLPCLLVSSQQQRKRSNGKTPEAAGAAGGQHPQHNDLRQIARLSAAVAFLGAPLTSHAEDIPQSVDLPSLDTGYVPASTVAVAAEQDVDAYAWLDAMKAGEITPTGNFAISPANIALPQPPDPRGGDFRQHTGKDRAKARRNVKPHAGGWHGGGQRYG